MPMLVWSIFCHDHVLDLVAECAKPISVVVDGIPRQFIAVGLSHVHVAAFVARGR